MNFQTFLESGPGALLARAPPSFSRVLSLLLLTEVPRADMYLAIAAVLLTASAFFQLHAFTRPPPVPTKSLPRRPVVQVNFKPDEAPSAPKTPSPPFAAMANRTTTTAATAATTTADGYFRRSIRSAGVGGSLRGAGTEEGVPASVYASPQRQRPSTTSSRLLGSSGLAARRMVDRLGLGAESMAFDEVTTTASTTAGATGSAASVSASEGEMSAGPPLHAAHDLPDSFAPLLSSSQMEVLYDRITADLIHAIQVKASVRLRQGRHEIPLNKDGTRPQFTLNAGKGGCQISASGSIGSDGFSLAQDLDVHLPTTTRSRPMVKDAGLVLDPPLPLVNVAPTLIHFPTLFEDNDIPSLRRIQIVRFGLDLLSALSSFLEKVLWHIESRAQIHLSRVRVIPLYKGSSSSRNEASDTPHWRLSPAFSGHVLLFGWIPVPFINVTLPSFIIPQPHALLEYLLTAQPLASARLKRENIAEKKIVLASIDSCDAWDLEVQAVATPPAVGVDLTMPGGLTVALEMMHGRDLNAGAARRTEAAVNAAAAAGASVEPGSVPGNIGGGIPRNISSDSLSSVSHPADVALRGAQARKMSSVGGMGSSTGAAFPPKPFDANSLVPWSAEVSVRGKVDRDKISLTVEKCCFTHEAVSEVDGSPITTSRFSLSGSLVVCKPDPDVVAASGVVSSAPFTMVKKASSPHLAALNSNVEAPSVYEVMLYPDSSTSASLSQRMNHLLQYDYAFDIGEDTTLDAFSMSIGATHPMLEGGTIITTVFESMYAFGSLAARENAVFDMRERRRKRNILRHLPAVDVTAGIANAFIPEESMSYHDDGQTIIFPEIVGGRMMIRVVGGFEDDASKTPKDGIEAESFNVRNGINFIADFGVSSFTLKNESKVNEFPELDIFEDAKLVSLFSGSFSSRICSHLRPQNIQSANMQGTDPNIYNPLEAYEIAFSGSSFALKFKEGSATLGHRRVIIPSETTFTCKIVESIVDMAFEGRTECELMWDFQGNSPVLQVTSLGLSPEHATHEDRQQVSILISDLRQGRLNIFVSGVGGISIKKAASASSGGEHNNEDKEGLYSWKFFNALVSPDDESPKVMLNVLHDKPTMERMLRVMKLINSDLERVLRYVLTQAWRAKDIFEQEGIEDPGNIIPGHRMARLVSLFLCGDLSEVERILPVIRRVVAGEGLDVMKVKELLSEHLVGYDTWAPEIDRAVRWADVMLGPMMAPGPYMENDVPPLSELPCYSACFRDIPPAKELYSTLRENLSLPLDPSFSNLVGRVAPYLSFQQVEFALKVRNPSDWQPGDLRRLRYVYSVKKKVLDISESYGGLSFLPQSFFVSVFLGEATRASLRVPRKVPDAREDQSFSVAKEAGKPTTLSTLRRRRARAVPQHTIPETWHSRHSHDVNDFDFMSPAGRVASQMNMRRNISTELADADDMNASDADAYDLGDSLLGPQDVAILLQAGLTSSLKGSTVVQLNQRMLLDLMASQPRTFAVAVLAEIGMPGGRGSARGLTSALMALLELDQSSFTGFHRLDLHALLESWLPGFKIPQREDYLAGGRWARQSYYEALSGVATNILEDAEQYMALKGHIQRVRHCTEEDPIPLPIEQTAVSSSIGIDIDSAGGDFHDGHETELTRAVDVAKEKIAAADLRGQKAIADLMESGKSVAEVESCNGAISSYREAFEACSKVLLLDKLAFQVEWFKSFYRRNYDALMIKSVYDNVINDVDKVRHWMDALRNGARSVHAKIPLASSSEIDGDSNIFPSLTPPASPAQTRAPHNRTSLQPPNLHQFTKQESFFAKPGDHSQQELIDEIIEYLFFDEGEREILRNDPLVRLLISNEPGAYNFTIVTAMGVITEGKKGLELQAALERLEAERGVRTLRSDTGTARSLEYNAAKIEEAIRTATQLKKPFGLLGYSQGCANVLTAESLMFSGTPQQQQTLSSPSCGLVCRQLLFSAANGSMHGPASDTKVQRLIVMGEEFFKYQQGYCSRAFIATTLELLNGIMDSAPFHKFIGGAQSMLPDGCKVFWREAQHLPHVTTCVLRGVLEPHTTPESLEMITNVLTKQSGSPLHDSQVHVYDAIGHPVYTKNRNGRILENCDMGGSVQRTHHWSPLSDEVEFVKTKRDDDRASFDCAKDRHVFPWVDVNARFGIIKYVPQSDSPAAGDS